MVWLVHLGLSLSILATSTNQALVKLLWDLVWLSYLDRLVLLTKGTKLRSCANVSRKKKWWHGQEGKGVSLLVCHWAVIGGFFLSTFLFSRVTACNLPLLKVLIDSSTGGPGFLTLSPLLNADTLISYKLLSAKLVRLTIVVCTTTDSHRWPLLCQVTL